MCRRGNIELFLKKVTFHDCIQCTRNTPLNFYCGGTQDIKQWLILHGQISHCCLLSFRCDTLYVCSVSCLSHRDPVCLIVLSPRTQSCGLLSAHYGIVRHTHIHIYIPARGEGNILHFNAQSCLSHHAHSGGSPVDVDRGQRPYFLQ